jgi:hypothetical protein
MLHLLIAAAALQAPSPLTCAPPTHTCAYAMLALAAIQIDLAEARRMQSDCIRERRTACTSAQGRVQMLEQQARLVRNYVDVYCAR